MLSPFAESIWIADGPNVTAAAGFHYPTRMAVIQCPDGTLWVWSPVRLTPGLQAAVDALGPVAHITAPNSLHHLSIPEWQQAYPAARCYAAPGLAAKRPDIAFDTTLGAVLPPDWPRDVDAVAMAGNLITTEMVFFHQPSRTALFADLLQQMPGGWYSGWRSAVAKLDLMAGPEPAVPRKFRAAFVNRRAARRALHKILAWKPERVLMAHGCPVEANGHAFLHRAFSWLQI
ncbi:DUF4336 domain-containing protein [Roseobacteraceae bacterium NS-SX3]